MPNKYLYYDSQEDVIFVDYSNLILTRPIMEEVIAEYRELARTLSHKAYAVVCYKNTRLDPALNDSDYIYFSQELAKYRRGAVRYELNNVYTNISLRTNVVRNKDQGANAHVYSSREEALAVVRQRLKAEAEPGKAEKA